MELEGSVGEKNPLLFSFLSSQLLCPTFDVTEEEKGKGKVRVFLSLSGSLTAFSLIYFFARLHS
jgi:hypothetical protein